MSRRPVTDREAGTVLLSTLLVLSLMSAVTLALLATLRRSVTQTAELEARAQADLYARGAQDFVQSQLDDLSGIDGELLNAELREPQLTVLPFDNGSLSVSVSDGTHCFRLSALSDSSGTGSDAAQSRFSALMQAIGLDNVQAARIAAAAVDWVDQDQQTRPGGAEDGTYQSRIDLPHRTANVPMESVSELRAVDGMSEKLFQVLRPHLCIGEVGIPTRFNLDTAQPRHAPVLAAILTDVLEQSEAERLALDLITSRPADGYGSTEGLAVTPALSGVDSVAQLPDLVFRPHRIVAEVIVRFGPIEQAQLLAYEGVDTGQSTLSYRDWGWQSFPSLAWDLNETESETP
ncbi:MAG: type II secretion system minor pseudopilin GspK [Pseudomonadota bacterium]